MKTYMEIRDGQPFGFLIVEDSLPHITPELRASLAEVVRTEPPSETLTHLPTMEQTYALGADGRVIESWPMRPRTVEERAYIAPTQDHPGAPAYTEGVAALRAERNAKLAACDWTQLPDAPLTNEERTAWTAYRQALRDVPEQAGFPWEITWPTTP